eukprot:TRINITY_DN109089_c0_g1_i1.p1 TRINITY_DN109089_c0_g1~~TRINITY_DN109089_c0_g1_i1.p1  ORF type:complete len:710 (+),score=164.45 TRINITY_DN109089_c0_g1_i1:23-2131(+)
MENVKKLFARADTNGNGTIDKQELKEVMRDIVDLTDVSEETFDGLFAAADKTGDNELNYDEFLDWLLAAVSDDAEWLNEWCAPSEGAPNDFIAENANVVKPALASSILASLEASVVTDADELVRLLVAHGSETTLHAYWRQNRLAIKQKCNIAISQKIEVLEESAVAYDWAPPDLMVTGAGSDSKCFIGTGNCYTIQLTFASLATVSSLFLLLGQYTGCTALKVMAIDAEGTEETLVQNAVSQENPLPTAPGGFGIVFAALPAAKEDVKCLKLEFQTEADESSILDLVVHGHAPEPPEPEKGVECECEDIINDFRAGAPRELFLEKSPWEEGKFLDAASALSSKHVCLSDGVACVDMINAACLDAGGCFKDAEFPADASSIVGDGMGELGDAARGEGLEENGPKAWRRMKDFACEAELFVGGIDCMDVMQGAVGDCWLISVIASLACRPKHLKELFYPQKMNPSGAYAVRMYSYVQDKWVWVVVDDFVPVGVDNRPYFMSAHNPRELWPVLLEKAFAKVNTCYSGLSPSVACGGTCAMTMVSGSGDVLSWAGKEFEGIEGSHDVEAVWKSVTEAIDAGGVAACGVADEKWAKHSNAEMDQLGVVYNHVFSCIGYRILSDGTRLMRLRNPWGEGGEWKGPWSDGAPEWTDERKAEVPEYGNKDDAAFFLTVEDFYEYWYRLEICRLQPMVPLQKLLRGKVDEE